MVKRRIYSLLVSATEQSMIQDHSYDACVPFGAVIKILVGNRDVLRFGIGVSSFLPHPQKQEY